MNKSLWSEPQFHGYLGSTGFSGMAFAMQQLLLNWILVGVLELPANQVGLIQAMIGIPGVFLMLMGGASADRTDPRRLLLKVYLLGPVFPAFLALVAWHQGLTVWSVIIWGLGMSVVQAFSLPAQQAILNKIAGQHVQRAVTAATSIGFVVQIAGLAIAGQIDTLGISWVLTCQAVVLLCSSFTVLLIEPMPRAADANQGSALQGIVQGLHATYENKVVFQTLAINFASTIFNAGSFMTVFPFIVKRVYAGDAVDLALLMGIFFAGAAMSNAILLRFQPLLRVGRLFLIMQLSRIIVLALLYIKGDWWLLALASILWGLNMGITSNLARAIVQEGAGAAYRGRIMAVFSITLMGSAPIGAIILGYLIEFVGTLEALWPAMMLSAVLFIYGYFFSDVWGYHSQVDQQKA